MKVKVMPLGPLGANCYIVTDILSGECAVIDPGEYNAALENALKDPDIKRLKYILLTHGHFDHTSGVPELKRAHNEMQVCIHALDEEGFTDPSISLADGFGMSRGDSIYSRPDIILKDGDTLTLGENKIEVIHTPGHTPGGVTYKTENMLFSGDTLFRLTYGRTDFTGGSPDDLVKSIKRLFALEGDYTVYPGHNISTTLSYEREHNRILRGIR